MQVIYVTDRNDENGSDWQGRFGAKLLANWSLTCGVIDFRESLAREYGQPYDKSLVSLPPNKEARGEQNCAKLILDEARKLPRRHVLVATHGYNNAFSDAVSRIKGFADDIDYDGLVVLWAWPSEGGWTFYSSDERAVAWSSSHFTDFFQKLLAEPDLRFDLFAHSMGNHILVALAQAMSRNTPINSSKAYVFAAPDVDQTEFRQRATALRPNFYTLYACTADEALRASAYYHATSGARAGSGEESTLLIINGVETIDTNVVGHSYIFDDARAVTDVKQLLATHAGAQTRGLTRRQRGADIYWIISP